MKNFVKKFAKKLAKSLLDSKQEKETPDQLSKRKRPSRKQIGQEEL
jgi:hypothetical protein